MFVSFRFDDAIVSNQSMAACGLAIVAQILASRASVVFSIMSRIGTSSMRCMYGGLSASQVEDKSCSASRAGSNKVLSPYLSLPSERRSTRKFR